MSEGAREFTVVLAHGPADAAVVASLAEDLRGRRQGVVCVAVVDSDAPLLEACAKVGGRGLFVIARGVSLGAERAEALRTVLRDIGVPMSRSLVLSLDASGPKVFADRVITVLRRIAGPEGGRSPGPPLPPRRPTRPLASMGEPSGVGATGYAVVPPNFDEQARDAVPTAPGVGHSAALAVDVPTAAPAPRRRRAVVVAATLATLGVLSWFLLPPAAVAPPEPPTVTAVAPTHPPPSATPPPSLPPPPTAVPRSTAPLPIAAAAEPAAPETEDSEAIVQALRKREIRALDVFVVAPEAKKPASFAGASAYCASLSVGGIADWRLPEIGELLSMSRAKMVRKGSFWSLTKGDTFGDLRLVLVIKRERISAIPSGWDGGRVICVRERA